MHWGRRLGGVAMVQVWRPMPQPSSVLGMTVLEVLACAYIVRMTPSRPGVVTQQARWIIVF